MKFKIILIFTIGIILLDYSSEICFMPNYKSRPDKWHLFYSMFLFFFILIIQFLWAIFKMIKQKRISWQMILIMLGTIFSFLLLNNTNGNIQVFGYVIMVFIAFFSMKFYRLDG